MGVLCVYMSECVDAGESKGQSELRTALLNEVVYCCNVSCTVL